MTNTRKNVKNLTAAAVCLALCMVLPQITPHIPQIGRALSPMHIPVLLCGFITGPAYAMIVGLIAPLMGMIVIGMPPPPIAVAMCFELAAYGLLSGALYQAFPKKIAYVYVSLVLAMLIGRFVWGIAMWRLVVSGWFAGSPMISDPFTWEAFLAGAFIEAVPGIILHIILIPLIVIPLRKTSIIEK